MRIHNDFNTIEEFENAVEECKKEPKHILEESEDTLEKCKNELKRASEEFDKIMELDKPSVWQKLRQKLSEEPFGVAITILCLVFIITSIVVFSIHDKKTGAHIYACPNCGSYDTRGFYTFCTNDGELCLGSEEYARAHADYSVFHCNNCFHEFKVYKNHWK